jgi:hypothetical protein
MTQNDVPFAVVGKRVKAYVVCDSEPFDARGEIIRIETLTLDTGEVITDTYPIIRLDDGREIGGVDCWWTEDWEGR